MMGERYDYSTQMGRSSSAKEHDIKLVGRRRLDITGVRQVESFDNEEFLLETEMGFLAIRGQNLHMKNLNVELGHVSIEGKIIDLVYVDEQAGGKSKGLFGKLFK